MSLKIPIDLSGTLLVDLKQTCPNNLISTRKDWAQLMTRGLPADLLSQRLSSIYSLCGQAHQVCSDMAIATALEQSSSLGILSKKKLQAETIREHIHRITLNWPNLVTKSQFRNSLKQQSQSSLLSCPAIAKFNAEATIEDKYSTRLIDWIEINLLDMPAPEWLKNWEQAPESWLNIWIESKNNWLSMLIREVKYKLDAIPIACSNTNYLKIHANNSDLFDITKKLSEEVNFNLLPKWRGSCAETGTWTRLNDVTNFGDMSYALKFVYRLADLVRLALPDFPRYSGENWLAFGSISTAPREAVAWVEMARGLLVHHVQLDEIGREARVLSCRTIAPTEWNFHPEGSVAQAIEGMINLDEVKSSQHMNALMATYDPCVNFKILNNQLESTQEFPQEEVQHA